MKIKLLSIILLIPVFVAAVAPDSVSQNVTNLMNKINQVNQDLAKKQKQQQKIDAAIGDSDEAIDQSKQLLIRLRQQRDISLSQLEEIEDLLPQVESATVLAQNNVRVTISKIYQQIKAVQNDTSSIMSGNNALQNNRKKVYLMKLLQVEEQHYQELQDKLNQLNLTNNKINIELDRLDKQLGITNDRQRQLGLNKESY